LKANTNYNPPNGQKHPNDPVVVWMRKNNIPVTRDNYISCAYLDSVPEEWTVENEMGLPVQLQDFSKFEKKEEEKKSWLKEEVDLEEEVIMIPSEFGGEDVKVWKNPSSTMFLKLTEMFPSIRVMRSNENWYFWNSMIANHAIILRGLGEIETAGYLGYELTPAVDYDTKEKVVRPYHDASPRGRLQVMVDISKNDPLFNSITKKIRVTDTVAREKEIAGKVEVAPYNRSGSHGHHVSAYERSLPSSHINWSFRVKTIKEDAMAVNHTGPGIANFDPLLMRKKKKRIFRRKPPIIEADISSLPMSGGVGEADSNSVVPKRKFRIKHRKPLKEAYNPNEPREPKGAKYGHGGRWTNGKWVPEIDNVFIPFPPIEIGEEDPTISKEIIEKLNMTESELKARLHVLMEGNLNKAEHLIAIDEVGLKPEEYTSNDLVHVSLPDELVERLRNNSDFSAKRYTMVHNHPWDSSLSGGDLNVASLPGVKRMYAVVATGSIYSVEQTQMLRDLIKFSPTRFQGLWDAMSISARAINEILSPFNTKIDWLKMFDIPDGDYVEVIEKIRKYWNRIASHLNCLLLNDAGVFNYTYHMDPKFEAFYAPLIKEARESREWKLVSSHIYHKMLEEVNKYKDEHEVKE
jgi:hypothetical protein